MKKANNNRKSKGADKKEIVIVSVGQEEKITMFSAFEQILLEMEDSCMAYRDSLKPYLDYITDLQSINTIQAIFIALFVEGNSDGSSVTISDLARFMDCPKVRVMKFHEDIDDLLKRKFLRKVRRKYGKESLGYVVPEDVFNAFKNDSCFVAKSLAAKDSIQFFQMFFDLTHQRKEEEIDTEMLKEEFEQLLEANGNLRYVKNLERLNLPDNSKLIVTQMARHLVLSHHESIPSESLVFLFDDRHEAFNEIHNLEEGSHILLKKHIVEYAGKEGLLNRSTFKLTATAREKLLKGFTLPKRETPSEAIKANSIVKKDLFFNEEVGRQIEDLSELLDVEKLTAIQTRLKEHGRRTGFACLFYGAPGTGKTESVLQLAHKTGRDIMQVDMSEIKSKWVGESEQNIKAVFDNYRALCKTCDRTPILLFNEADAILGTRMGQASQAVDKMENTIQNIVLQEMETLDGIMIATTNLEQSLDSAFERRFIYKVRFDRPDIEQRQKIWLSMLPTLSDDLALQLATSYDFSGGQIENIVRKCDVESILYGETSVDVEKILRFCQEETILKNSTSRIGFI